MAIVVLSVAAVVITVLIFSLLSNNPTVDEPCHLCGTSPSVQYETSSGQNYYLCNDCNEKCEICGEEPTERYEITPETIHFICDECYEIIN